MYTISDVQRNSPGFLLLSRCPAPSLWVALSLSLSLLPSPPGAALTDEVAFLGDMCFEYSSLFVLNFLCNSNNMEMVNRLDKYYIL